MIKDPSKDSHDDRVIEAVEISPKEFNRLLNEERKVKKVKTPQIVLKKEPRGDPSQIEFRGPWSTYLDEGSLVTPGPSPQDILTYSNQVAEASKSLKTHRVDHGKEKSILHGDDCSYFHVPLEEEIGTNLLKSPQDFASHVPLGKLLHTWIGHEKAVNSVKFFPNSGHLMISASMDCKVKLWDVYRYGKERPCVRTLIGHNKPVKLAHFNLDGSRIISLSFDRYAKLWDTETGSCIQRLNNYKIPYCAAFSPADPNLLLVGGTDGLISQWDLRTGENSFKYTEHTGTINSIIFIDGSRFVSTSDDNTIRTWDIGSLGPRRTTNINPQVFETFVFGMMHPGKHHLSFQSLSNQVVSYEIEEDLGLGRRISDSCRIFLGHNTTGYACHLTFSPDGHFLASGDGKGFSFFWDWKTGNLAKRFKTHDQACVGIDWNPQESTKFATCGWDGLIKYWA